jgi:hypothetical protein
MTTLGCAYIGIVEKEGMVFRSIAPLLESAILPNDHRIKVKGLCKNFFLYK